MSKRNPTLGYPTRTAFIAHAVAKGFTLEQVAELLEEPVQNIRSLWSARKNNRGLDFSIPIRIRAEVYRKLHNWANENNRTTEYLVNNLLLLIVNDNLIESILDEDNEETHNDD